mmetsp:Transcript_8012/g.17334  ORF Transcript_8012/g.17334 Transcript_8012/m.17334 type:complete len:611 (-) Transcript_8012:9-1841(-)
MTRRPAQRCFRPATPPLARSSLGRMSLSTCCLETGAKPGGSRSGPLTLSRQFPRAALRVRRPLGRGQKVLLQPLLPARTGTLTSASVHNRGALLAMRMALPGCVSPPRLPAVAVWMRRPPLVRGRNREALLVMGPPTRLSGMGQPLRKKRLALEVPAQAEPTQLHRKLLQRRGQGHEGVRRRLKQMAPGRLLPRGSGRRGGNALRRRRARREPARAGVPRTQPRRNRKTRASQRPRSVVPRRRRAKNRRRPRRPKRRRRRKRLLAMTRWLQNLHPLCGGAAAPAVPLWLRHPPPRVREERRWRRRRNGKRASGRRRIGALQQAMPPGAPPMLQPRLRRGPGAHQVAAVLQQPRVTLRTGPQPESLREAAVGLEAASRLTRARQRLAGKVAGELPLAQQGLRALLRGAPAKRVVRLQPAAAVLSAPRRRALGHAAVASKAEALHPRGTGAGCVEDRVEAQRREPAALRVPAEQGGARGCVRQRLLRQGAAHRPGRGARRPRGRGAAAAPGAVLPKPGAAVAGPGQDHVAQPAAATQRTIAEGDLEAEVIGLATPIAAAAAAVVPATAREAVVRLGPMPTGSEGESDCGVPEGSSGHTLHPYVASHVFTGDG